MDGNEYINPNSDIIDSRDVIARIDYLAYLDDEPEDERDQDDYAELIALRKLQEEAEGYAPDWHYGETLINDSYFEDYAQQLAEDIGAIDRDLSWPNNCIDWEQAARELQWDYTLISFDGEDFWIRS
jgi:hypothetical protein